MIALSAATTAIAAAGVLSAVRGADAGRARLYLIAMFVLFAGVASIPLVVAFARDLYVFYMPAVLPMLLALPPAVYHYVAARTAETAPQSTPLAIHWRDGVLPAAGMTITLGYWLLPATSRTAMFVDGEMPPGVAPSALAFATFALIFFWSLASFGYLVATLRRLGAFRARLKDLYSNTDTRELRWVDWLMAFLVALWGAAALSLISDNFGPGLVFPGEIVFVLAAALLLFVIAFASIPPTAEAVEANGPVTAPDNGPQEKYARSALSEDHARRLAKRIEKAMREDALYLDANLSLQKLSRHVGAPPNLASQTLNEEIGSTFFDYVAHWRIEAAKPRILSGKASILAIALEVGFNSRSTFYKAFKRETGMTPNAFREANGQAER
ncbi:MAG: AraC family transcriptional regulator [Pseudomonadota bacterium]